MLTILDELPEGILDYTADQLYRILDGPTLIHIEGIHKNPVFISVLLHGNEQSGWQAIQQILREDNQRLARSISLFIGNVSAAKQCLRHLPEQQDFNRIWDELGDTAEHQMVRQVLDEMRTRKVFAAIDIHNNTGFNPHYACINNLDNDFKYFARQFAPIIVFFKQPDSVLSIAFSKMCPTVTIECGQSGEQYGIQRVVNFVNLTIAMDYFPKMVSDVDLISIYQTIATVKIVSELSISFGDDEAELQFDSDLEQFNFREINKDKNIAKLSTHSQFGLVVYDDENNDVTERYFYYQDGYIKTRVTIIPAMLTQNIDIIKSDCLCYLMAHIK